MAVKQINNSSNREKRMTNEDRLSDTLSGLRKHEDYLLAQIANVHTEARQSQQAANLLLDLDATREVIAQLSALLEKTRQAGRP